MEEDVTFRNSKAVKQRRLNMVRTPTAVVSEVFGFLNDVPSAKDDDDELIMSDGEVDQLFSNLDMGMAGFDETNIEDQGSLLLNGCLGDKYLTEIKSKDSGFASLERQRCEPSSLYDSFLENDDEIEDAVESVCSNDIIASISESLYDDLDVSAVPRSISMEAKSTCVDDETENAIALSAEKFGLDSLSSKLDSNTISMPEALKSHSEGINNKCSTATKGDINITITMIKTPFVDQDNVFDETNSKFSTQLQTNVASEETSVTLKENIKIENNNNTSIVLCDSAVSFVEQKSEAGNVFDFVVEPDGAGFAQSGVTDSYCYGADGNVSGELFDYEVKESVHPPYESCGVDEVHSTESENFEVGALVCSTSSDDDEEEDIKESDCTPSAGDQAYDMIDIESHVDDSNNDTDQFKESDYSHSSEHTAEDSSSNSPNISQATTPLSDKSPCNVTKRHKLEKNPSAEMASDDSSDEDVGIYAESFRRSNWIRLSQQGKLDMKLPDLSPQHSRPSASSPMVLAAESMGSSSTDNADADEIFNDPVSEAAGFAGMMHKRTDSMTTTASETEFKFQYVSRRKCLIQRADSQQEYHRLSSRVYDQDKQIILQRTSDSEDLGLHLLNSHPAFITSIDPGSVAEKAGLTEGLILVSVNDQNVLTSDHADIVQLIQSLKGNIKLGVANSDFQPVRDLQATIMSGYMHKLGNSAFKIWKKRFFILRQDNCLYYYKNDQETDPLGALPLGGYTISRHTETSKDYCFKAEKYGGRTYYFIADNRDQMTEWVGALTEAAARSKKRKESFLSVSSHNVGLPALHIVKPECAGFLGKLCPSQRTWRRRYCVLKNACVYYYKDKNSVSALGVAHFHGYTVDVENYHRKKHSFTLQPPEKKMRVFCFSADNETDKKRWVESLIHSIQRWVRVDREAEC